LLHEARNVFPGHPGGQFGVDPHSPHPLEELEKVMAVRLDGLAGKILPYKRSQERVLKLCYTRFFSHRLHHSVLPYFGKGPNAFQNHWLYGYTRNVSIISQMGSRPQEATFSEATGYNR